MMEKSKFVENHGTKFIFNACKMLGKRCLPKLCRNISTVITPYEGKDSPLHMAQRYREVQSVFLKMLIPCFLSQVFLLGIGNDLE